MPSFARLTAWFVGLICCTQAYATEINPQGYGYPISNPFEATIATTPPALRPALPDDSAINQDDYALRMLPERKDLQPAVLWPVQELRYRLAKQDGQAPLVFIIAGTGSLYSNSTMEFLKKLFYGAGMHVVQLSSPTSFDFISAASQSATPGFSPEDAKDLYAVMKAVKAQHPDLAVSEYLLTGYSLGGLEAAFVSHLDETEQAFNFKRVLLLNPPVNLLTSISNLDRLVQTRIKGVDNSTNFFDVIMAKLTRYFHDRGGVDINEAMLYDFQQSKERLSNEELAMLIGTAFRFASADIVFTSDLINQRGLITPPAASISTGTSLTPYFEMSLKCDFECYMTEQLVPMWRERYNGSTIEQLVQQASLYALENYLRQSEKIAVMHNADDLILGPGDLGFLQRTLGPRLTIYPLGGHCGNLNYTVNSQDMLEFFRG